jgi:ATP-dependent exoDNAse (exonuclease V) alpha subunit
MDFLLNDEQIDVIQSAVSWFNSGSSRVFEYSGGPGTGKTTILKEILYRLHLGEDEIAPMSFIGAAVINMRNNGLTTAKTIHSWIFDMIEVPLLDNNGKQVFHKYYETPVYTTKFIPKDTLPGIKLIIIDEGSCVPMSMRKDIEKFGIPILVTGDLDQLPPVGDRPAYLYDTRKVMRLNKVMRQAEQSSIVQLAQRCKLGQPINIGYYGDSLVIYEEDLTNDMILSSDIIICGTNNTKNRLNNMVRKELLGIKSTLPVYKDRLICRKNNWKMSSGYLNLANGLIVESNSNVSVIDFDDKGKNFNMSVSPLNSNIRFDDVNTNYAYYTGSEEVRKKIKMDKYSSGELFEPAYAITSHLSQGSQFANVLYIEEYMGDISAKLNYVGVTRATNSLIYVKKKPINKFYSYKR